MTDEEKKEDNNESDLDKLKRETQEYLDGWKRAEANLINYKKDELKRLEDTAKFGSEALIVELISVLDSFDLGIAVMEQSGVSDKGIYIIKGQLDGVLERRGLKKIKVEVGDKFDGNLHEVVNETDGGNPGTVAEEVSAGYALHDKVIRPVRIKIFK